MSSTVALLADIGGTNTRLAVLSPDGREGHAQTCRNADFGSLAALLRDYLSTLPAETRPARGALAVACPVDGDAVRLTNLDWRFSIAELGAALKLAPLHVINDFTAVALAVPRLQPVDWVPIGGGTAVPDSPIGVIGPGTGLGVSGLVPAGGGSWVALAGEGGHASLAAATAQEAAILDALRRRHGHVSAERVVSGPGLLDLYHLMAGKPNQLKSAEEVTGRANDGYVMAQEALGLFFSFLGNVAGNLALTLGARGGVYLAGGILPRMAEALAASAFRERFVAKGRFRAYLEAIPTRLILAPCPAFKGLAACLEQQE